jgi:hypothetical protein
MLSTASLKAIFIHADGMLTPACSASRSLANHLVPQVSKVLSNAAPLKPRSSIFIASKALLKSALRSGLSVFLSLAMKSASEIPGEISSSSSFHMLALKPHRPSIPGRSSWETRSFKATFGPFLPIFRLYLSTCPKILLKAVKLTPPLGAAPTSQSSGKSMVA